MKGTAIPRLRSKQIGKWKLIKLKRWNVVSTRTYDTLPS